MKETNTEVQEQTMISKIKNITKKQKQAIKERILSSIKDFCQDYNIVGKEQEFYSYMDKFYGYIQDKETWNDFIYYGFYYHIIDEIVEKFKFEISINLPSFIDYEDLIANKDLPYASNLKDEIFYIFTRFKGIIEYEAMNEVK